MKNIDVIGNAVRRQISSMFIGYQNMDDLEKFRALESIKCLAKTFISLMYAKEILAWSDDMTSDWMSDTI